MHNQWKQDPQSVDSTWNDFFESVESGKNPGEAFKLPTRTSKVCTCLSVLFVLW